jgi:hypothetical protein
LILPRHLHWGSGAGRSNWPNLGDRRAGAEISGQALTCCYLSKERKVIVEDQDLKAKDFPKRVSEGVTAKLDFDYSCNRGNSFGEYHVHGVVNEVLSANIDPNKHKITSGFPHALLKRPGRGRQPEIDFAIHSRVSSALFLAAEVKWAGSAHCTVKNILKDLIRLQLIANAEHQAECFMLISGRKDNFDRLFNEKLLIQGTKRMLERTDNISYGKRSEPRIKTFSLQNNLDYQIEIDAIIADIGDSLPSIPDRIISAFQSPALSAPIEGRFQTHAWRILSSNSPAS